MKFNEKDCAFGRHETFPLRFSWLPKGYQEFSQDPEVFESDNSTVKLGVGKNMVSSIKHWMKATQLLTDQNQLTEYAHFIFDEERGCDPYLEDEATIWLLHWLLCSNPNNATTWFWFFNQYVNADFDVTSMQSALEGFVDGRHVSKSPAKATLKSDCAVLLRMYSQSDSLSKVALDEALDSPMSLLGLIDKHSSKSYSAELDNRDDIALGVFGFAFAQCVNCHIENDSRGTIPTKSLMLCTDNVAAVAATFRMTEMCFMTKLEQLQEKYPHLFEIRETAGISQVYLAQNIEKLDPMNFIKDHYQEVIEA
ncbi:DUF4007 family protein [Photobacterium sp. TY1-4]|uniref:DUF4007 family protein n=1 Tax=Photobacterium sp. TY1-4 TaxID=2899122 RepID=UPI0021BF1938|nr:DUF4007 family protein [Photobacterium sp. TY1-4]UXI00776.1 DUF4007 family protein [Photobacterium sp. TY1-4]